jgi:hypothetical protein
MIGDMGVRELAIAVGVRMTRILVELPCLRKG